MKSENKFILELIKGEYADKQVLTGLMNERMEYPYILGQLLYNRVGAIAYLTLKQSGLLQNVNREFRNTLKAIYEYNSEKTESYNKAIVLLSDICKEFKFPYALLKGAYLVEMYPTGLRTSNDVDILIEAENITKLTILLNKIGFERGNVRNEAFVPAGRKEIVSSRMNRGETVPFIKELNLPGMKYLELDINFSLGFRPGVDEKIVSDFLSRSKPLIRGDIYTLDNLDFLLHLCSHLYKEATTMSWVEMNRDIALYKYCDIFLYLNKYMNDAFSNNLIRRLEDVGLIKECYYAINYTKELFCMNNPSIDKLLNNIRPNDLSFLHHVVDPQNRKEYSFDIPYCDWIFCDNRRELLYEA